jgi:hypothetical protein
MVEAGGKAAMTKDSTTWFARRVASLPILAIITAAAWIIGSVVWYHEYRAVSRRDGP